MGEDYIDQLVSSGQGTTMDDIVRMTTDQKPKELSPLAKQLLANWQGLGENVGIGSAGTERAEIGGRPLAEVAEDFARRLSQQGVTDISQAKFAPGAQAAWTPEGHGNVSLVATKDGRLVPVWGSSSDASKARQVALAIGASMLAPGLASALGGGVGGAMGSGAMLGAGRAAISGGDILEGALTGGLTGGAGYGVSTFVDPFAADIGKSVGEVAGKTVGEAAKGVISGAARSGVGAAFTGGDIGDALLSGALGGGINTATADVLSGLPKDIRGPVAAAVSAGMLGKDPTQAAIMSYAGSLLKQMPSPFKRGFAEGEDAQVIPGFFAPGGEGYMEPEAGELPSWMLDPYKTEPEFLPASEVIRERQSLEDRFPPPEDTLNLEDFLPGTGRSTTTDQTIDIIGKREKDIPDWDVLPNLVTTPRSIRDVGPVTQIKPGEKLEGTTIKEPDLSKNLPTVPGGLKLPTKQPGKPATQGGLDLSQLAFLIGMMQHKPKEEEEMQAAEYQPFDRELMYGLRG